jgi:8-oxo-dGTP pyrophosphatase MutT (NUDIX family)
MQDIRDANGLTEAEFLAQYDSSIYPHPSLTADVVIFKDRGEGESPEVLMIRRKGHPYIGHLALPGGFAEKGESIETSAARELEEETGYRSDKITPILKLKSAVAYCSEFTDVYLAEDLIPIGGQHLDEAEEIRIEAFDLDTLLEKIYSGQIQDAKTAAGILAYSTRLYKEGK